MLGGSGQDAAMFWQYLGLVISFAFRRTTFAVDMLQILAASAVPAVAKFAGVDMPASTTNDVFAYIGLAAIAFVVLRIMFAPFFLWKEQVNTIGDLRFALSKPEQIEIKHLAKRRAKVRMKLARITGKIRWEIALFAATGAEKDSREERNLSKLISKALALSGLTHHSSVLIAGFGHLQDCFQEMRKGDPQSFAYKTNTTCMDLVEFLQGEITAEALALRLPPDTEQEKRP